MSIKRFVSFLVVMVLLMACACAEGFTPAAPLAEWNPEDFDGTWRMFYRIDGGEGKSTAGAEIQISMVIDGNSAEHIVTINEDVHTIPVDIEYTAENAILTYTGDYVSTADAMLLEDGTMQWHQEADDIVVESYLYFEKVEPEA